MTKKEKEREQARRERMEAQRRAYEEEQDYNDEQWDDERQTRSYSSREHGESSRRTYSSQSSQGNQRQGTYPQSTRTRYAPSDDERRTSNGSYQQTSRRTNSGTSGQRRTASSSQNQRGSGGGSSRYDNRSRAYYDDPDDRDLYIRRDPKPAKKKKKSTTLGLIFSWIQLLISLAVFIVLFMLDIAPVKYLAIVAAIFVLLFVITFVLSKIWSTRIVGRVMAVIISVLLAVVMVYLVKTYSVLDEISGAVVQTDEMSVVVLADDEAESINDAVGYTFGTATVDSSNASDTVDMINEELSVSIATAEYDTYTEVATALLEGEVGAIILNEAYRDLIEELYEDFSDVTKIIHSETIETQVIISSGSNKKVSSEPFVVFISGIDVYGSISKTSRSDVNILAAVNPNTHEIALVTTPRDSYVELASYGSYDKLTHAGLYGVSESMATLENLYGIEVDYYVRVNFTGFEDLVDALGGITVYSDYTFSSSISSYSFTEGYNTLDGAAALAFARERKAFSSGDYQRGINQMRVIEAIIDKAISPTILTNYTSVLDAVSGSLETSMSSSEISSLVKLQLNDGSDWSIESYEVTGSGDTRWCYSYGSKALSVIILSSSSVSEATELLESVLND